MRKYRQLHLWIGLLTSVLILIEAVTGLLLSEPALMGQGQSSRTEMRVPAQNSGAAAASLPSGVSTDAAGAVQVQGGDNMKGAASSGGGQQGKPAGGFGQQGNSFVGFIHGLHEGRVGSVNVKWLADVTAVGLIILTVTGISLSLQTLRAQRRSRNKRAAESLHR